MSRRPLNWERIIAIGLSCAISTAIIGGAVWFVGWAIGFLFIR